MATYSSVLAWRILGTGVTLWGCRLWGCVSDSVRPQRQQPTRLPRPWDSLGENTGVGCHFLLQCMKVKSENEVAQSCPTLCNPMDCNIGVGCHFLRRRQWHPTPVLLPGKSHGWRSLVGYRPRGRKELDTVSDCTLTFTFMVSNTVLETQKVFH